MSGKPHPRLRFRPRTFSAPQFGQQKILSRDSSSITSKQSRHVTRRRSERRSAFAFDHREIQVNSATSTIVTPMHQAASSVSVSSIIGFTLL